MSSTVSRFAIALLAAALAILQGACGRGDDADTITVSGHVEATEVRVSTKVPGRLLHLSVAQGDEVTPGHELAQIDTTDLHLALQGAKAERALADAEHRLRLAGTRREEIAASKAAVEQAESELEAAERDLVRMRTLYDSGSSTEKQRDDAQTRRDVANARAAAAREQFLRLQRGSRVEEIDSAAARLDAAEARLAQAKQHLSDARITSPIGGRVTEKLADEGELLGAGTGIFVVTELKAPWLTVYLSEPDLSHVALGQQVEVETDAGVVRSGRLTYVSSEAEFTPRNVQTKDERVKLVFEARITLENPDGLWKPGMPAEARIPVLGTAQ